MRRVLPTLTRPEWRLFLLLLACYVYFLPRYADWSQSSRAALILAITHDGRLEIDAYAGTTGDYAELNGHRYSDKAPGPALLGVPAYAAVRWLISLPAGRALTERLAGGRALLGTLASGEVAAHKLDLAIAQAVATWTVVSVAAAALGVCFCRVLGHLGMPEPVRLVGTLGYALATSAFPYAGALYSHQLAAALLFGAFALLWKRPRISPGRLVIVGTMLGLSLISEYATALLVGGLGLYALALTRRLATPIWLGIGMLPPLAVMAAHNWLIFGTPLPVGYAHSTLWQAEHQTGFFSLSAPTLEAFWGITFGAYRGLFFISPFLLLGVAGLPLLLRERAHRLEALLCCWCVASFVLFNSSSIMWSGGFGVGPRYLVPMLPFLALGAAVAIDRWRGRAAARAVVGVLLGWSFVVTWALTIGGQSFPDYDPFPLLNRALPALRYGDIARSWGTLLGLSGWWSVLPLAILVALLLPRPSVASWARTGAGGESRVAGRLLAAREDRAPLLGA